MRGDSRACARAKDLLLRDLFYLVLSISRSFWQTVSYTSDSSSLLSVIGYQLISTRSSFVLFPLPSTLLSLSLSRQILSENEAEDKSPFDCYVSEDYEFLSFICAPRDF